MIRQRRPGLLAMGGAVAGLAVVAILAGLTFVRALDDAERRGKCFGFVQSFQHVTDLVELQADVERLGRAMRYQEELAKHCVLKDPRTNTK